MTFPSVIDSTMLSAYRGCPTKFHLGYEEGYHLKGESIHLIAGKAFASATETARRSYFIDGLSNEDSVAKGLITLLKEYGNAECPYTTPKTLDRMAGAFVFYYDQYPLDKDPAPVATLNGVPAVEFSFGIPLPINHPVSGEPLIYAGRCDAIVNYAGGLYTLDEKTTSRLGPLWDKQWDLRGQFVGYAWALREQGYHSAGTIIRGVSILKDKYETQSPVVSQPEWKIDEWESDMLLTIQDMVRDFKRNAYVKTWGSACTEYSGCSFHQCCMVPNPSHWLKSYYEVRFWNPLDKTD